MSDNAFNMVRKIRHLPGLKLTATLDPTQVSKRVKTSAQKMLRSGVLTLGYRSKARLLAEQMLSDAGRVSPATAVTWAAYLPDAAMLTNEAREQIEGLLGASKLIDHASSSADNAKYINDRYAQMVKALKTTRIGRLSLHTYQLEINMQIAEVVSACRTPLMLALHNELADKLDSTEPFHINF